MPVFVDPADEVPAYFVAARGHHVYPLRAWLHAMLLQRADRLYAWSAAQLPEEDDLRHDRIEIEAALRRVLSDVREAVEDWPRMRAKAVETADQLEEHPPAGIAPDQSAEAAALLRWVADDNFTFLGYR